MPSSPSPDHQQHTPHWYHYKPIQYPDTIRMLQLLPGQDDKPIHINLSHYPLTYLKKCEALSYEWGSSERNQDIICEGAIIKGTPNLLAVLKILRCRAMKAQDSETGLLWIDAICINQEDKKDKCQQLPLMGEIYRNAERVLVWIGEERALSRKAFEIISLLDQAAQGLEGVNETGFNVAGTLELESGVQLQQLSKYPAWPDVLDVLASRSYFSRLWTVQEVALSNQDKTQVLCGRISCPWLVFCNAARVVQGCTLLRQTIQPENLAFINSVENLRSMQLALSRGALGLIDCVGRTEQQQRQVSRNHDRVFALLGMLQTYTRNSLSPPDYDKPAQEIFQIATLVMVLESQLLNHFIWRDVVLDQPEARSWVGFSEFEPQYRFSSQLEKIHFLIEYPITFEIGDEIVTRENIFKGVPLPFNTLSNYVPTKVDYPILVTRGFVFDEITASFQNFCRDNFPQQLLAAYHELRSHPSNSFNKTEDILEAIWSPLSLYNDLLETKEQCSLRKLSFTIYFSRWALEDFGIANEIIEKNKVLKVTGEQHPLITANLRENFDQNRLKFKQEDLQYFLEQAGLGVGGLAKGVLETFHLYREKGEIVKHFGRNLFFSSREYIGIGPMGDNRQGNPPTVQVGDRIMILAWLQIPIILRPHKDGLYTLIGPAHLPGLVDDFFFKPGKLPKLENIRIR